MTSEELRAVLRDASDSELRAVIGIASTMLAGRHGEPGRPAELADDLVLALDRLARAILDVVEVQEDGEGEMVDGRALIWRPILEAVGDPDQDGELVEALAVARTLLARLGMPPLPPLMDETEGDDPNCRGPRRLTDDDE